MSTLFLRLGLALLTCSQLMAQQPCIDSVTYRVKPVQCFSYRNGEIIIDSVHGGQGPYYYALDGQTFSTRHFFDRLYPGQYTLSIRDEQGCSISVPFEVTEPDEITVSLSSSTNTAPPGKVFRLEAVVSPANALIEQISWRPPDLFNRHDTLMQMVSISETTNFAVEVVSKGGCTARDQVLVELETPKMYFPNIIRIGSNENAYFTVYADESIRSVAALRVYGRDGGLVFENYNFQPNDQLLGWNGRITGRKVLPGVYTWMADLQLQDGSIIRRAGSITVVK